MAKYVIDETTLTAIADSIRAKKGTTADITPEDMPTEIEGITTGGDSSADELIQRSITEIVNDSVTSIGDYAFCGCNSLTKANFSKAITVGNYSFQNCRTLLEIDFPQATTLVNQCFRGCTQLRTINMPLLKKVGASGFYGCSGLLKEAVFPVADEVMHSAFQNCYQLQKIDLPLAQSLAASCFYKCRSLTAVILRYNAVCYLALDALDGCYHILGTTDATYNPNGDKDGYIYVPSALVDSYKSATNWSKYADQIRAIEDYPDITGG